MKSQAKVMNISVGHDRLRKNPFFAGRDPAFLDAILSELTMQIHLAGENIMREGDVGDSMYFLNAGCVEVLISHGAQKVAELEAGSVFGEMSVLGVSKKRTATIKAKEVCDCRVLSGSAFKFVLNRFPAEAKFFDKLAIERRTALRKSMKKKIYVPRSRKSTRQMSLSLEKLAETVDEFWHEPDGRTEGEWQSEASRADSAWQSEASQASDIILPRMLQLTPIIPESPQSPQSPLEQVESRGFFVEPPAEQSNGPCVGPTSQRFKQVNFERSVWSEAPPRGGEESPEDHQIVHATQCPGAPRQPFSKVGAAHSPRRRKEVSPEVEKLFVSLMRNEVLVMGKLNTGVTKPQVPRLSQLWDRRRGLSRKAQSMEACSEHTMLTCDPKEYPAAACGLLWPPPAGVGPQ